MLAHGSFMLIIIAAYTANLASFLTIASMNTDIQSWSQVAMSEGKYKLALPEGQSHESFINFEKEHYGYKFNVVWKQSWEECMDAVVNGEVDATFEDAPVVQYYLQKTRKDPCSLMTVGTTFAPVGYGMAFGVDSVDFIAYSQALVELQQLGLLTKLAKTYDIGPAAKAGPECNTVADPAFHVDEMWGLILVTACGLALGPLATFCMLVSRKSRADLFPRFADAAHAC